LQSAGDAGAGKDPYRKEKVPGDPLRQRSGIHQPAFSSVVHGEADRVGAHPAREAAAEWLGGKFQRQAAGRALNVSWFENLWDARRKIAAWQKEFNEERPHRALGYQTPAEFARQLLATTGEIPGTGTEPVVATLSQVANVV